MSDLVALETFPDRVSAELARTHLDAHGVRAFLSEGTSFNPLLSAAEGVRLSVAQRDLVAARDLLRAQREAAQRWEESDAEDDPAAEIVRCPRCELEYCFFEPPRLADAPLATVLFSRRRRWRCRTCAHVWDDADAGPKRVTRLPEGEPRASFRLERRPGAMGSVLGMSAGLLGAMVARADAAILAGLGGLAGWLLGQAQRRQVCSDPACRAPLREDDERCPRCEALLLGPVKSGAEHFARVADHRRAVAARHARMDYRRDRKRRDPAA